jgi:hypothetical protein
MGKTMTMKGIFNLLEKIAHKPQAGLNDKVRMDENIVIKLG